MKNPNETKEDAKSWASKFMSLILEDFSGTEPEEVSSRALILSGALLGLAYNLSATKHEKEQALLANQEMAGYVLDTAQQLKAAYITVDMEDGEFERVFRRKK